MTISAELSRLAYGPFPLSTIHVAIAAGVFDPTAIAGNDDTGDGSELAPYATLLKALSKCPSGMVGRQEIKIDGTHDLPANFVDINNVTLTAEPGTIYNVLESGGISMVGCNNFFIKGGAIHGQGSGTNTIYISSSPRVDLIDVELVGWASIVAAQAGRVILKNVSGILPGIDFRDRRSLRAVDGGVIVIDTLTLDGGDSVSAGVRVFSGGRIRIKRFLGLTNCQGVSLDGGYVEPEEGFEDQARIEFLTDEEGEPTNTGGFQVDLTGGRNSEVRCHVGGSLYLHGVVANARGATVEFLGGELDTDAPLLWVKDLGEVEPDGSALTMSGPLGTFTFSRQ